MVETQTPQYIHTITTLDILNGSSKPFSLLPLFLNIFSYLTWEFQPYRSELPPAEVVSGSEDERYDDYDDTEETDDGWDDWGAGDDEAWEEDESSSTEQVLGLFNPQSTFNNAANAFADAKQTVGFDLQALKARLRM